jgi:CRISPR-associated protein Csm4
MEKIYICKIEPYSSFHIGTDEGVVAEKSDNIIHSDTLFGGIISSYSKLYGDDDLREIKSDESFVLSSAFPYCKDILFFPKPLKKINLSHIQIEDSKLAKQIKSVEFVSLSILVDILKDNTLDIKENMIFDDSFLISENEVDELKDVKFIIKTFSSSRNVLDRITNLSEIFYIGETKVNTKQNCGFYFFIKPSKKFSIEKIKSAIELLGDEGLGGDRSVGKGSFKIKEFNEYELPEISLVNPTKILLLSLYNPQKSEIENGILNGAEYDFTIRSGWLYTSTNISWRKKQLRMFKEGSVLRNIGNITGRIVNVAPDEFKEHKIYQNGLAFYLPF